MIRAQSEPLTGRRVEGRSQCLSLDRPVDFLHDDFERTRGLELTSADEQLIRRMFSILSQPETLAQYAEHASQRKP